MNLLASHPSHAFMPYPEAAVAHASSGPLHGLTFAAKDLFDVAGYPTSGGNAIVLAMSGVKAHTAPAVQRLLDAGAEFVGKTVTDELAFSMNGQNAHFGSPVNGADPRRITGGSSSGSAAAVSNGLCDFALGTDTGGSVRAPASHCGLFGLRPTHGRIPLDAVWQLCPSFDTCGFFARDIATFARVADVLLGADTRALPASPRLLVADDLFQNATAEARPVLAPHVERLDACFGPSRHVKVADRPILDLYWAYRRLQGREAWASDGRLIETYAMSLGADVASRFAFGRDVTDEEYGVSRAAQREFTAHLANLLGDDGVLVMPTMPDIAPLAAAQGQSLEDYRNASIRNLCLAPLSGFPQLNLPLARRAGAPLGLSLLGPRGSDRSLVAVAERFYAMNAA